MISKIQTTNMYGLEGYAAAVTGANAALAGVATDRPHLISRVITDDANSGIGYSVSLLSHGDGYGVAGAAITEDQWVVPDATGRWIPRPAGEQAYWRAETAASGAGRTFQIFGSTAPIAYNVP
jgi:hypothetical protein